MSSSKLFADLKKARQELTKTPRMPELVDFSSDSCVLINKSQALNGVYRDYMFKPNIPCITMDQLMDQCSIGIYAALELCLEKKATIKAYTTVDVLFYKINCTDGTIEKEDISYMSTCATPIVTKSDIDRLVHHSTAELEEKIETFTNKGSNWIVGEIKTLILKIVACK